MGARVAIVAGIMRIHHRAMCWLARIGRPRAARKAHRALGPGATPLTLGGRPDTGGSIANMTPMASVPKPGSITSTPPKPSSIGSSSCGPESAVTSTRPCGAARAINVPARRSSIMPKNTDKTVQKIVASTPIAPPTMINRVISSSGMAISVNKVRIMRGASKRKVANGVLAPYLMTKRARF